MPKPALTSPRLAGPALLLLAALLYLPGLAGPYIFDDGPAITGNPYLRLDATVFDQWRSAALSSGSGPTRRPVAMATLAAERVLFGEAGAAASKAVNLLIHLACGALLYFLAAALIPRGMGRPESPLSRRLALLAAGLWLLAPLHVSTVLYAVQRMAQLSTLFTLAGLLLFVCRREAWARRGAEAGEVLATGLWLGLLTLLATFSKENGLLLPWLIAAIEVSLFRGQWRGREIPRLRYLGLALFCLPLLLLVAFLLLSPETLPARYQGREFSLSERLLTQARLLWQYLAWLVLPDIDAMGFQHDDIPLSTSLLAPLTTLLSLLAWGAVLFVALVFRRRAPLLLFALLFYLVGHFVESGLWPLEMVYEHRNYLPSAGVFIALAVGLWQLARRLPRAVRPRVPLAILLAGTAILLFLRVQVWADPLRLSAVNVHNHPESSRSHFFLAETLIQAYGRELQRGGDAPVDQEQRARYLALSRHHFELMYQNNPRDIAALVMLYYLDSAHFSGLTDADHWYRQLLRVLETRPLQASDSNALETLIDCVVDGACATAPGEMAALFAVLERRYPQSARIMLLKYRYLQSLAGPAGERLALLARAQRANPATTQIYSYQVSEYAALGDMSAALEAVRLWLSQDRLRLQLRSMLPLFGAGQAPALEPAGGEP